MVMARSASRWAMWHYVWSAIVVSALLLNVFWPVYPGYSMWALSLVAYPVAAALILANRPGNRVGRVLAVVGMSAGVVFVGGWAVWTWQDQSWSLYVEAAIASGVPILFWGAITLLYIFPTGHTHRWIFRAVLVAFTGVVVAMALLAPFEPGPMPLTGRPNPLAGTPWVGSLYDSGLFVLLPGLVFGFWAAIARFRSAGREIRQQLRWFMAGIVAVVGLVLVVAFIPETLPSPYEELMNVVVVVGFWSLPASIVIAVTRYHLYEIDRFISRTISYGFVVGTLAAAFFGVTALITSLLPTQNSLAVAASTLTVAALFNPLRRRTQGAVDKRFNRSTYEAGLVADRFASSLRESLAVEQLVELWRTTVDELLQPETSCVWLAERHTKEVRL
jgi:hypothetical protein